jgi:hypothetical protein
MISTFHDLLAAAFPLVLLFTGGLLHLFAPHHRMLVEERVKDRAMTETQARREIGFVRWSGPLMTGLGVVLLALMLARFFFGVGL